MIPVHRETPGTGGKRALADKPEWGGGGLNPRQAEKLPRRDELFGRFDVAIQIAARFPPIGSL